MCNQPRSTDQGVVALWNACLLGHLLLVCVFIGIYIALPAVRPAFVRENGMIEQGTAFAYLLAGVYGTAVWIASRRVRPSAALLLIPLIGFLGFLDEVSYGQSLLHFQAPVVASTELDSGHDLLQMATKNVNVISLCLIVPAGAAAMWIVMRNARLQRFTRAVWRVPSGRFVVSAVALGVLAQIIDTAGVDHLRSIVAIEETLELLAAVTMLGASAAIGLDSRSRAEAELADEAPAAVLQIGPRAIEQSHRRAA